MADAKLKFDVDTKAAEDHLIGFGRKADEVFEGLDRPHVVDVDTKPARDKLGELADLAKTMLKFEAVGAAGDFLTGISEGAAEARTSLRSLQSQVGGNAELFDDLKGRAVDAFRNGLGGSVAEATALIGNAQKQLGAFLDPAGVEAFTTKMAGVKASFGVEIEDSVNKSRSAIAAWGLDGEKAGNLVALGLQRATTPSDDFLDTLAEYSPLMKEAGFSADEFTGTLIKGAEAGAFSLDKVADAMKETQIRLKAGDITAALGEISSPVTKTIQGIVEAGEQGKKSTKEVMLESAAAIEEAFDAGKISETVRSKLQIALSGTQAEELGTELYSTIFSAPIDEAAITEQAAAAGALIGSAIGATNPIEQAMRDAKGFAESAAASLAPYISGVGEAATATAQMGPAITLVTQNMDKLKAGASAVGSGLASFLTNPAGIAVLAVVGLGFALNELTDTRLEELEASLAAGEAQLKGVEIQKQQLAATIKQTEATPALAREYEKLATKTNLTGAEQKRLTDVSLQLNKTYPGLIKSGGDYAGSLDAVRKQAEQTKGSVARLQDQMVELNRQSERIAAANRKIQAEILQEQIVTKLFTAQSGTVGQLDVFFNNLIGRTSSGVQGLSEQLGDFFKQLLNSDSEADVVRRIGNLQLKILSSVQSGKISKESQQELAAMLVQLETTLKARFKAAEETAVTGGRGIGDGTGTGIVEGIRRTLVTSLSGAEGVLGEAFESDLQERILKILRSGEEIIIEEGGSLGTKILLGRLDEEALVAQKLTNELERISETYKKKRESFESQLYEIDPSTGQRREKQLTEDVRKQLKAVLKELDDQEKTLVTETTNSFNRILNEVRAAAASLGGVTIPIRTVVDPVAVPTTGDPVAALRRQIADLEAERDATIGRLRAEEKNFLADNLAIGYAEQLTRLTEQLEDLTGVTGGFASVLETQLLAGEGLWRSYFDSVDVGRMEQVRGELDAIRTEEQELELSLARRGKMTEEDARRRVALATERAEKERELERETADFGAIALRGSLKAMASLGDGFAKEVDKQLEKAKDSKELTVDLLGAAAGQMTAIMAEAALANEDILAAGLNASIDMTLKLLFANEGAFLFGMFGKSITDLGPVGGPLAFAALAATLGALGALAKSALNEARPTKREHGGLIEGGTQYLVNDDPFERPEWLVDARSTEVNRPILEFMKRNPGTDLSAWVRSVARESIAHDMADRRQAHQRAADHEQTALDLKELTREVRTMRAGVAQQTEAIRGGIPVRGEIGFNGRDLVGALASEHRRSAALR